MRLSSVLKLAWKNLWSRKLRTTLTIGGVGIGIGSILYLLSLGYGLEQLVTKQVATFEAFTQIDVFSTDGKTGKVSADSVKKIRELSHVDSVGEITQLAGRVKLTEQNATTETVVFGIEKNYFRLSGTEFPIGTAFDDNSGKSVVVNRSLLDLLGIQPNDKVIGTKLNLDLVVPKQLLATDPGKDTVVLTDNTLDIVGIVDDEPNPVLYLPTQFLVDKQIIHRTSLQVKVDDGDNIASVRHAIESFGFSTEYIGDTVDQINQVFSLFRLLLGGLGGVALIVALMGSFNTLTISLIERTREIGLFKTLGMTTRDIFRIFITESLTIGLVGGLIGIILSTLIGIITNIVVSSIAMQSQSDVITIYISPWYLIVIMLLVSLLLGFITGFYPAMRAVRTKALDVLRYE